MKKNIALLLVLCVCALALSACGKSVLKTESVTGVVTLDGQPLEGCTVMFTPQSKDIGASAVGRTDATGTYKLQTSQGAADAGTTPGTYNVTFQCLQIVEPEQSDSEGNTIKEEVTKDVMPAKYKDAKTSGFTAEVVKGANTFNFDLTSK